MSEPVFFIVGNPPDFPPEAIKLSQPPQKGADVQFLHWQNGQYFLCDSEARHAPLTIDFMDKNYQDRRGKEYLPKAFRSLDGGKIADATAGWGKDGWLLAQRGFVVTLYERHFYLFTLLNAALTQAKALGDQTAARLSVVYADAAQALPAGEFAAIYLDPMYPERRKKAKVKQPMQALQLLLSSQEKDDAALFARAFACAAKRVVVKRPKGAALLTEKAASYQIDAPNTRYDIYQC